VLRDVVVAGVGYDMDNIYIYIYIHIKGIHFLVCVEPGVYG
jgi:hypothetical protein